MRGYEIDWQTLHDGETCRRISLPTYPFTLERYWVDVSPLPPPREDFTEPENEYLSLRSIWQPRALVCFERRKRRLMKCLCSMRVRNSLAISRFDGLG